jgi:hypothetical protein
LQLYRIIKKNEDIRSKVHINYNLDRILDYTNKQHRYIEIAPNRASNVLHVIQKKEIPRIYICKGGLRAKDVSKG